MKLMTIAQIEDTYGYPKKVGESKEAFMKRVEKELKKKPQVASPANDMAKAPSKVSKITGKTPEIAKKQQPKVETVTFKDLCEKMQKPADHVVLVEPDGKQRMVPILVIGDPDPRMKLYDIPLGCVVTFPSDDTWNITYRGREDSGHISADLQAAINQIIK